MCVCVCVCVSVCVCFVLNCFLNEHTTNDTKKSEGLWGGKLNDELGHALPSARRTCNQHSTCGQRATRLHGAYKSLHRTSAPDSHGACTAEGQIHHPEHRRLHPTNSSATCTEVLPARQSKKRESEKRTRPNQKKPKGHQSEHGPELVGEQRLVEVVDEPHSLLPDSEQHDGALAETTPNDL